MTAPAALQLKCPPPTSTGAFVLRWDGIAEGTVYFVAREGKVVARTADTATTIVGQPAGSSSWRVGARLEPSAEIGWSNSCVVQVAPPTAVQAWGLFAIGGVVVAATVALVLRGGRTTRAVDV